jgi:4-amino-4-deoxy-L-arabinose transferase-like glycosyltransferase
MTRGTNGDVAAIRPRARESESGSDLAIATSRILSRRPHARETAYPDSRVPAGLCVNSGAESKLIPSDTKRALTAERRAFGHWSTTSIAESSCESGHALFVDRDVLLLALSWATVPLPGWIARALRVLTSLVALIIAGATVFAAIVVPYRFWDSLAFGSWSRSIAETGELWANTSALSVSRPLFYVPQGLLWWFLSGDEWLGRLSSATFGAALVAAVWVLARQLATDRSRDLVPPLAVMVLLSFAVLATYVAAGMTDVPVAAATAATAVVLFSSVRPGAAVPLAAVAAAATVLAKPSGVLALVGLVLATLALRGRTSLASLTGVAIGVVVALGYDAWHATRLDISLIELLKAGNDDFWLARGDSARFDSIAGASWVGDGARLVVVLGLVHGIARALGARARVAVATAVAVAISWSVAGPLVVDHRLGYPFDGSAVGSAAWLVLAAAMVTAAFLVDDDPTPRRTYVALLLWLAPIGITWAWQRADEARLLAPTWPALALLSALALTTGSLALARLRPAAAIIPASAVAAIALANVVSIDGLGRDGWRSLLDLGSTGWRSREAMENFAYGPFSYELNLARENVTDEDRIVSSDGRLAYFFPGRVDVSYARSCSDVRGVRFFSYLTSGESLQFAQLERQPVDPLAWVQCANPRVELVGEQPGIYAAFVVGDPPARAPTAEDCRISSTSGTGLDAVFGADLSYAEAKTLLERALTVGFVGTRIERTGCSSFRVVVTGIPEDEDVQAEFLREVRGVDLNVEFVPAERFPEVSPDVPPASP